MTIALHHGDCRTIIPTLEVTVDAVVTDAPYGLEFMGVAWDTMRENGKPRPRNEWGDFGSREHPRCADQAGRIRLNKSLAFEEFTAEWARIVFDVLRPGGFLVAFGGTRTYHRLACAIEDAGFVIQDCLMWLFATGFPKRRDMLKPAYEPIVLAYKPGGKRTMQVDECRIAGENPTAALRDSARRTGKWPGRPGEYNSSSITNRITFEAYTAEHPGETLGRWPANICHDGSDEVVALFPQSSGQQGDVRGTEPSRPGLLYGGFGPRKPFEARGKRPGGFADIGANKGDPTPNGPMYGDTGSAARFSFSAKAGAQDRWGSKHPTVKPVELMKWLVALVTPPGGTVLDPFAGSGTTAVAALATGRNAILIEQDAGYVADIRERLAFYQGGGQHSMQAKNRNRKIDHGPLFAAMPLTPAEQDADSLGSYTAAVTAIGELVRAGEPVPEWMLPRGRR